MKYFGAVDIGGTKIAVGIAAIPEGEEKTVKVLAQSRFPTGKDPDKAVEQALRELDEMGEKLFRTEKDGAFSRMKNRFKLEGIGISCAGPVDTKNGTVDNPYTLPGWEGYPITKRFSQAAKVLAVMENDANCALLGEIAAKGLSGKRVLMITVGTGIGCAFWDGEQLYRTGRKYHPELGHVIIGGGREENDWEPLCYCKRKDCAENLISGTALHRRARSLGFETFDEAVKKAGDRGENNREEKDRAAQFLRQVSDDFKRAFWNYGLIFQPDAVILGGGMAGAYFDLFEKMKEEFDRETKKQEDFVYPFLLFKGEQKENPALTGAAWLAERMIAFSHPSLYNDKKQF